MCPKCGKYIHETDKWCMNCGTMNIRSSQESDEVRAVHDKGSIKYTRTSQLKPSGNSKVSTIFFFVINGISLLSIIILSLFIKGGIFIGIFALLAWFYLICFQRIFEKAGRHWWEFLIPIYGTFMLYKIALDKGSVFFFSILISIIPAFLPLFGVPSDIVNIVGKASYAMISIISIILYLGIATKFGVSRILMLLFPYVMIPIIAFLKPYRYN